MNGIRRETDVAPACAGYLGAHGTRRAPAALAGGCGGCAGRAGPFGRCLLGATEPGWRGGGGGGGGGKPVFFLGVTAAALGSAGLAPAVPTRRFRGDHGGRGAPGR